MNKVFITGNLCKENEVRKMQTQNGTKTVIHNSIASKRNFKNKDGEYDSDFIYIVVHEPTAKFMEQYAHKGDKVAITGRWQHRTYTDQYGNTKYVDECVVDGLELMAKPQNKQEQKEEPKDDNPWNPGSPEPYEDDLPF